MCQAADFQTFDTFASMQIQDGAIPGLMDIVSSEGISTEAKEEAEGILEELSSRKPDSRFSLYDSSIKLDE